MNREEKAELIAELQAELGQAASILLTDMTGMDVESVNSLRVEFRKAGVKYRVAKNTLIRRAVEGTDAEALGALLTGPTALAWHNEEPAIPAKIVKEFVKNNNKFVVKGAYIDGQSFAGVTSLTTLADMPSKDELRSRLLGLMKRVPGKFLALVETPPRKFLAVLLAYEDKLKEGQA